MNQSLRTHLEKKFDSKVEKIKAIPGGSINEAARFTLTTGETYFVKWNTAAREPMFRTEARGLELLRSADSGLVFPEVRCAGYIPDQDLSFLVMNYMQPREINNPFFEKFGRELALLHKNNGDKYGLDHDNFIGRLPQDNTPSMDWLEFLGQRRLRPQFEAAVDDDQLPYTLNQNFERLLGILPEILPNEQPSLLHGDLWSGNYLCLEDNQPALVDPAVYYGNREIELSFTKLFGGFHSLFYQAYHEAMPLQPGFESRVEIYNLYPLLAHVNMFGRAYASQVQAILQKF